MDIYTHTETPEDKFEPVNPDYTPDLNDTEGRINWSDKTIAEYKAAGTIDYWTPTGSLSIVKDSPWGTESDVMFFESNAQDQKNQLFIKNTPVSGAVCAAFETDVKLVPTTNSTYEFQIRTASGTKIYTVYLSAGVEEGIVSASGVDAQVTNTWFRLRLEYKTLENGDVVVLTYVNGELIHTTDAIFGAVAPAEIGRIIIASSTTADCDMYLDNTKLEFVTAE